MICLKSNRKKWVLAYLDENKPTKKERQKRAEAVAKAIGADKILKVLNTKKS